MGQIWHELCLFGVNRQTALKNRLQTFCRENTYCREMVPQQELTLPPVQYTEELLSAGAIGVGGWPPQAPLAALGACIAHPQPIPAHQQACGEAPF